MARAFIKIGILAFTLPAVALLAVSSVTHASETLGPVDPKLGAVASESDSADLASLPLEQLMDVSVITTASKFEQSISDAPSAVVVLTAQDIKDFGWRTLADALASLPGLYVSNDRNYSYLGARGFLRPGDYDSRFLLMIDGYRTNDAVYDEATIGTEGLIDMDLVERIEYVPGPGSAVYGSNAFFGVVNVITKKGSAINGAQTAVAAGSYGEKKARATYGWHGQNGADIVLSATSYIRDGQDLFYPEFNTPQQNNGVAQGLDYDRAQNFFAKVTYGDFTVSAAHSNRTKGVPTGSFGAIFNTPNSTNDAQSFINAVFAHQINSGLAISTQAYWGRYDYQGVGLIPGDVPTTNVDGDHALWYGGDAHVTVTSISNQKIVAGFDFQRDARRDQYNYNLNPYVSLLDDKRASNRTGAYIEDEIQLPANFALNAGLRYDWDSVTASNVNPRLALIYKLTSRDTAKLIYGTAYRAPNAYELYYAVPGSGGQLPNPDLKPEHITTTELVLDHAFSDSGRATLSLFRYSVKNLISLETDPASGLLIYQNLDQAKATGVELATEQLFGDGYRVRASYSWQLAKDGQTGAILQNSPRHLVKLNAVAPFFHDAVRFGTELQCVSSRLSESSTSGGYCLANLTVTSSRVIPRAIVSLSVYNAFNKRYSDPAGPAFVQQAIEQQSRTLYAKLVYGF
jgi:outer membrane receptor protein involved in Fe transport